MRPYGAAVSGRPEKSKSLTKSGDARLRPSTPPGDVKGMPGDVKGMSGDVKGMSGDVRGMSKGCRAMSGGCQRDVGRCPGDVKGMLGDVKGMSGDVRAMSKTFYSELNMAVTSSQRKGPAIAVRNIIRRMIKQDGWR